MKEEFTHIDKNNQPTMVDISDKANSYREAIAESTVILGKAIMALLENGDINSKKGPVFQTAIIAGTMAIKNTSALIPFCHPLPVEKCRIEIVPTGPESILIRSTVSVFYKTGVEMEALTGASVAALTVYDMCKAVSKDIVISETKLISKTGGKSDHKTS